MNIEIIDDGVGAFAALSKLKFAVNANYTLQILDGHFPLGNLSRGELFDVARQALQNSLSRQADVVVVSSIALSMAAAKILAANCPTPVFGCEAPILHAGTYTVSRVLVAGDTYVAHAAKRFPDCIAPDFSQFPLLAESGAGERDIVAYIAQTAEKYSGSFDCIALGCSSMNLYKHCFSRVFPNAKIFDSLEGVARKMRKKLHGKIVREEKLRSVGKWQSDSGNVAESDGKTNREGPFLKVLGENSQDLSAKYNFFIEEFQFSY